MSESLEARAYALIEKKIAPGDRSALKSAGRIDALLVENGKIALVLSFQDQAPEGIGAFRANVEAELKTLDGVTDATVVLTGAKGSRPRVRQEPKAAPKTPPPPTPDPIPGVSHVIAVASGKGGVGKSTTSINLALALISQGLRVGLLDADIFGPSVPTLIGLHQKPAGENGKIIPHQAMGLTVMSIGFMIDPREPVVWRGPRVMGATQQMLHDVEWGDLDVLVVDMPPGTGDVQLTMVQRAPLSGAVIVSTPQDLALIDARKGIAMFEKVDVPILGIIENMSQFVCPHCGESSQIFGHGGARTEAETLGVPFLGEVPLVMKIREAADSGQPTVFSAPDSPEAHIYAAIAGKVKHQLDNQPRP